MSFVLRSVPRFFRTFAGGKLVQLLTLAGVTSLTLSLTAEPLSLETALQRALARNPTLKVENYNPKIARANLLAAYGAFDPALTLNDSYTRTVDFSAINDAAGPGSLLKTITSAQSVSVDGLLPWGTSYSVGTTRNQAGNFGVLGASFTKFEGVTITQPVLRDFYYNSASATLRLAKVDRSISDWDYRLSVSDIVTNVIVAYNNLSFAQASLSIATKSRELAFQLLHENERRVAAGSMAVSDVVEARARAAEREEAILFASRAVADASNSLRQLLGENVIAADVFQVNESPWTDHRLIDVSTDVKVALNHRPEYEAARLGVSRTRIQLALARNQLLPRLDLIGSFGYGNFPGHTFKDEDNTAWTAGIAVSVPLTFARGRGNARAARLRHEQEQASLASLESEIALEVTNGAGQIETTRKRVAADRAAYELGQQTLAAEEKKLRAGSSSTFVVIQYQDILSSLESSLSAAMTDQRNASANYDRILGMVLEKHGIVLAK